MLRRKNNHARNKILQLRLEESQLLEQKLSSFSEPLNLQKFSSIHHRCNLEALKQVTAIDYEPIVTY